MMKKVAKNIVPVIDVFIFIFVIPAAVLLKVIRRFGVRRMKLSSMALKLVGVFPVRDHYYEPQFIYPQKINFDKRTLSGVDLCIDDQIKLIEQLTYANEIIDWPRDYNREGEYHLNNDTFASGDAEFFYQIIRHLKPARIYEVGSGYSTLIAQKAIKKNKIDNINYKCNHVCIEPYEMPWLEKQDIKLVRTCVEDINPEFFLDLEENDILFIDSSHIIRPKGDVLFLFLTILPLLKKGVVVHIHDIFTPRNYLAKWLRDDVLFWNEQFLLEAFLTQNTQWKVMAALNYLHHEHGNKLSALCPYITPEREPGSFYIKRISE